MSRTARLALPYILQGQAQKEVTHNEALNRLDVFVNTLVEGIIDTPPSTPNDGEIYIIGTNPSDVFNDHANELTQYTYGSWSFYKPIEWMEVVLRDTGSRMRYNSGSWVESSQFATGKSNALGIEQWEEYITLSGKSISTTSTIPDHSSVIAVNTWVTEDITGTNTFSIGVKDDLERYGSGISSTKDTTNVGMTYHPITYYYNTPIIFTAESSDFTGGIIKVSVHYLKPKGSWPW